MNNKQAYSRFFIFSIVFLFFLQKLNAQIENVKQKDNLNDTIKNYDYKMWTFKVNNEDSNNIGYEEYKEDESIGPKSLVVCGNYVYITDVYHSNIKEVNITTGEMRSSKRYLSKTTSGNFSRSWFRDIAIFNDKIYVTTDKDSIFCFSKKLSLLQSIPTLKGDKHIFSIEENELLVYLNDHQLPNHSVQIELLSINKDGQSLNVKKQISIEDYEKKSPIMKFMEKNTNYISRMEEIILNANMELLN